ncbi:putative NADH:ubiquinone oxidoreductase, subunit RnfC [Methylophaga aminisulfidivorans MP]|uniref:Ion-translocating oxidoreductase complex subunit C n=1 Tax=Methylophaga aminisulfidivorans MP TaxID=1026882 RepID=F5T1N6_9GAMM|nr:electron transport complex subunit RsxC [Methylophaga aminisulfidivorans]EGL53127.1 putative NADH:ubiquinone oxidoreductase, subunit RnfC [Methylophaga aminisulfidivorans MP]
MTKTLGSFPGGLKLPGHKKRSTQTPIRKTPLAKRLTLPLQQHIGSAAIPIVDVGDKVLKGQQIARADGHVSVCLHAPSSGTIIAIEDQPIPHPSGLTAPCITIETDGEDRWVERHPVKDYRSLSAHEIRQIVRDAGIVGLGGAGFPSFIKLNPGVHHTVETLLLNGAECEPYISCDDMLMRERADGIIDGVEIMQYALRAREVILAIEDNKPQAISAMELALASRPHLQNTRLVVVPTRYPTGGEKQLIQVVTGKEVPSNGLPIDLGIVSHNMGTAYAVGRAIHHGEPLISRIVTVTGKDVTHAGNFETLFGTPISEVLAYAETKREPDEAFILGGPMMGFSLSGDNLPVTKTANCILAGVDDAAPAQEPLPCIRCGDCASACPASLLPQQLYWHSRAKDFDQTRDYNLFDCIECGCCDYVCPSKIPLVSYFRFAKTEIMNQEREHKKSDLARDRFETRQARLEREQREKEERQRQRKAALAASKAKKEQQEKTAETADADNKETE